MHFLTDIKSLYQFDKLNFLEKNTLGNIMSL